VGGVLLQDRPLGRRPCSPIRRSWAGNGGRGGRLAALGRRPFRGGARPEAGLSDAGPGRTRVAERRGLDRFQVSHPEPVGDAATLLRRLRERADGGSVVVGFDFPIGVPAAYASRAGVERFPKFLAQLGRDGWSRFYDVAEKPHEIGVRRPFYPMRNSRKGEVTQRHVLEGLGVASMNDLLRACDRATESRGAACPIFWTLGGKQVGKAAIIGWPEVLTPALNDAEMDVGLWPFDGSLDELVRQRQIVTVETYPAEACTHLGLSPPRPSTTGRPQ
jgi:hypothetical protein